MNYELKEYKILGYTTDFNICDCCGKADLKGTIAILAVNYDVVLHFGTTCAAKADKYDTLDAARKAKKEISSIVREFDEMRKCAGSWANKQVRHIRLEKGLTYDNCMQDQEYADAWKTAMEFKYREFVASREAREAERTRLANRTPEQVEAEEKASRERWEKWRAEREINYA
jgi:hypothetical protein